MYTTLLQSDTLQSFGHVKADTSPGGVGLRKKTKDLSVHEREEREHGGRRKTKSISSKNMSIHLEFVLCFVLRPGTQGVLKDFNNGETDRNGEGEDSAARISN